MARARLHLHSAFQWREIGAAPHYGAIGEGVKNRSLVRASAGVMVMVAQERPRQMSVEAWRDLLRTTGRRYEYSGGWVYVMAGGSLAHMRIALNMIRDIEDALGTGPCTVYGLETATRLSPEEYRFPDVTVTCDKADRPARNRTEVQSPRVCLEVRSRSIAHEDETEKAQLYRACPTVQEYGFVYTRFQLVELHRRTDAGWLSEIYRHGDVVELASIGVRLPVADIYRRTDVPERREQPSPLEGLGG
jgi:Uma2 family endonuclease